MEKIKTIIETYYQIGRSDETNETFSDSLIKERFGTKEDAELYLKYFILEDWGRVSGYERKDFEIAKITRIIERE